MDDDNSSDEDVIIAACMIILVYNNYIINMRRRKLYFIFKLMVSLYRMKNTIVKTVRETFNLDSFVQIKGKVKGKVINFR